MISPLIHTGKILLGNETLRCPHCGTANRLEIYSDMAAEDWLACSGCGYRSILNLRPILKKYGLPQGLSRAERRQVSRHLQKNIARIN